MIKLDKLPKHLTTIKQTIEIETFNPYEFLLPNRKLLTHDTLTLVKLLRQEGHTVIIKPNDDIPVEYLFKKGYTEIFADPVYAFLINTATTITTTIATTLFSNYVQKLIDKHSKSKEKIDSTQTKNNFIISINNTITNLNGKTYSASELKDLKGKQLRKIEEYKQCFSSKGPYLHLSVPLFKEHRPKIVGWCILQADDKGLKIKEGRITDKSIKRKLSEGKFKGASITGVATEVICSICKTNWVECNHMSGEKYSGKTCLASITQAIPIEVSLVKKPINPECLVQFH